MMGLKNISHPVDFFTQGKYSDLVESGWHEQAGKAEYCHFPDSILPEIQSCFINNGIDRLYLHQAQALKQIFSGKNVVITTGTSSGKSLCFQIPVLQELFSNQQSTSLLLFPTKALEQDQFFKLTNLSKHLPVDQIINLINIFDGDTDKNLRLKIRNQSRILLSNPDMLHLSILPNHTKWFRFFQSLSFIVIDEVHIYRGVFGSHLTNIIRRLKRITTFYRANPVYILTSATISNAKSFSEKLIEERMEFIDKDYSTRNEKHYFFINPPVINPQIGLRKGMVEQSMEIANDLIGSGAQCILFARSRRTVEYSLFNLYQFIDGQFPDVRGYRSGYLPEQRRKIESGIREGKIKIVIATNALELGIDMGKVDTVIMMGYPGSIASFFQQSGRAGRENRPSIAILVATQAPLDQYMIRNMEFLKAQNPEEALIDPDNRIILKDHLRCAAHERPFTSGDSFGNIGWRDIYPFLKDFLSNKEVIEKKDKYFYILDNSPAQYISIRNIHESLIQLLLSQNNDFQLIGEIDHDSAQKFVHPGAVYLQEGIAYRVIDLDLENHLCKLDLQNQDFFTEPRVNISVSYEKVSKKRRILENTAYFGELLVTEKVIGYKKVDSKYKNILSVEDIDLPENILSTKGFWLTINNEIIQVLENQSNWINNPIDYGPDWKKARMSAIARDLNTCQNCGMKSESYDLHVHHIVPFRTFSDQANANELANLISLCPSCHKLVEQNIKIRSGLSGFAYLFSHLAQFPLMCDQLDIGYYINPAQKEFSGLPTFTIYDNHPGGIGLSERIFEITENIFNMCWDVLNACSCENGCPGCIGPSGENSVDSKKYSRSLLELLIKGNIN